MQVIQVSKNFNLFPENWDDVFRLLWNYYSCLPKFWRFHSQRLILEKSFLHCKIIFFDLNHWQLLVKRFHDKPASNNCHFLFEIKSCSILNLTLQLEFNFCCFKLWEMVWLNAPHLTRSLLDKTDLLPPNQNLPLYQTFF